eukprot:10713834-Karenia_brevis.AAC.1
MALQHLTQANLLRDAISNSGGGALDFWFSRSTVLFITPLLKLKRWNAVDKHGVSIARCYFWSQGNITHGKYTISRI